MAGERIVFFGNERIATGVITDTPVLKSLIRDGYNVVAVVANYERAVSRKSRDLEVAAVASEHNIPLLLPAKLSEIREQLLEFKAVAGALVAYGKIIPQSIIDIFPKGIINIHPSALPKHRGPTPLESVMLDGSTETAVSIMMLVKAMDAGPVYAQTPVALTGTETKQALADTLLDISARTLHVILPKILAGTCTGLPQEDSDATYDQLITKDAGILDFTKPALQLEREVRAYAEWPKSRTTIANKEMVITQSHIIEGVGEPGKLYLDANEIGFYTSNGIFVIDSVKPAGKADMPAKAFIAGYRKYL